MQFVYTVRIPTVRGTPVRGALLFGAANKIYRDKNFSRLHVILLLRPIDQRS